MKMSFKLSDLEAQALSYLDLNANLSFSDLAKQLKVSKVTVGNLVKRLTERGILNGFSAVVDVSQVNQTAYAVFLKLKGINDTEYKKLISIIIQNKSVHGLLECGGPYDLMFAINCYNLIELQKTISSIQEKFSGYIHSCQVSTRTTVHYFSRAYLNPRKNLPRKASFSRVLKHSSKINVDETDKKILNALSLDCSITLTDLAKSINISRATLYSRIAQLEARKILIGYLSRINCEQYGFQTFQIFISSSNKSKENILKLITWANSQPNVVHVAEVIASWDMEIHLEVSSNIEMQKIIRELWLVGSDFINNVEIGLVYKLFNKYAFTV